MRGKERIALTAAGVVASSLLVIGESNAASTEALSRICVTQPSGQNKAAERTSDILGVKAKRKVTKPYSGITYLQLRTQGPTWAVHTLMVDLTNPKINLEATPPANSMRTVSSFGKRSGVEAAINGDFFFIDKSNGKIKPRTLAVGNGHVWAGTKDNTRFSTFQFDKGSNCVEITNAKTVVTFKKDLEGVVGGHPLLVWEGKIANMSRDKSLCNARHPRTAVGLSKDGKTLFMTVVDGRRASWSNGMTCKETAIFMQRLGAYTALNLDGGGSSTMWLKNKGVVNKPSQGSERTVLNHLGVDVR